MAEEMQFSQLHKLRDLDLDLGWGRGHTGPHVWSRSSLPTHQIRSKSEKLFVDIRTDGRFQSEFQFIRLLPGDDLLKIIGHKMIWFHPLNIAARPICGVSST